MQNSPKHCIWLTFESELLETIIADLSKKYRTSIFQPHCTIIGKTEIPVVQLKSAIVGVRDSINLKKVTVSNIEQREDYWMSYYLTFYEKQIVSDLRKRLVSTLEIKVTSDFYPHISLMYNLMEDSKKEDIKIPIGEGEVIKTRSIQITDCSSRVEEWKPIFELNIF